MIDRAELGVLFDGLRASVTIADQDFRIRFMNDRSIAFYAEDGGAELVGKNLLDCHNAEQGTVIRDAYARYRAQKEDGAPESIVHIPLMVEGQFRGIAELIWKERADLVFDS